MKASIIITGEQGCGKSKFVELMTKNRKAIFFVGEFNPDLLSEDTEFIVMEEIKNASERAEFTSLSTVESFFVTRPWPEADVKISTDKIVLIGLTNETPDFSNGNRRITLVTVQKPKDI